MSSYLFRRLDNDELVEVDFATMMTQQHGFITLPDGVEARRVYPEAEPERAGAASTVEKPIVSDALGFPIQCLEEYETDRKAHGLKAEYVQDPSCEWFVQVKFDNERDKQRYMKHHGYHDYNSKNGSRAMLTQHDLDNARRLIEERYGGT